MRSTLTKRDIGYGVWLARKATQLLTLVAAGAMTAPRIGPADRTDADWRDWLAEQADRIPFELRPGPNDVGPQAIILAACDRPSASARNDDRGRQWIVDLVRWPVSFLALEAAGIRSLSSARIEPLIDKPQAPLWDATFLWAIAWWSGWAKRVRNDAGLLKYVWPIAGWRLVPRLALDEVWSARRDVLDAVKNGGRVSPPGTPRSV